MYAYIKGHLSQLFPTHIVVETSNGIGYEIQTPNSYRFQKYLNQECKVFTSLIVREDAQLLYGFISEEEKEMFLSLIKVTGIGPKSALAILATSTPNEVKRAIENENDTYLTKFPGIGKKTARQIVLDLKGKVKITEETSETLLQVEGQVEENDNIIKEALLALAALGYSKRELSKVEKVLNKTSIHSVDEAVKIGLKRLYLNIMNDNWGINMDDRMVDQSLHNEESSFEFSLRPTKLKQYIGQSSIKNNLEVFIKAAKLRDEPLDHVLLFGPPGLGKTTLSNIIANEMEVNIRTVSGPSLERPGDLAAILSGLQPGDVLFIDEIHRLSSVVEEVLYSAMEDFFLDIIIGKGDEARSIRIDLPPFTLVGATTRAGSLTGPLRDRFGVHLRLEYYSESDLKEIIIRTAEVLGTKLMMKVQLSLLSVQEEHLVLQIDY